MEDTFIEVANSMKSFSLEGEALIQTLLVKFATPDSIALFLSSHCNGLYSKQRFPQMLHCKCTVPKIRNRYFQK
jgi:hypothetical protein